MKRFNTLLCSIAFAIAGICMAVTGVQSPSLPVMTVNATQSPVLDFSMAKLPKHLEISGGEQKSDTVYIHDTVPDLKKGVVRSKTLVKERILYTPVLYIATPVEKKDSTVDYKYRVDKVLN